MTESAIVTRAAILGRGTLMPGIQITRVGEPQRECHVAHSYREQIVDESRDLKVDVRDCIIFTVTHLNRTLDDPRKRAAIDELLEDTLLAISDVLIWEKTKDVIGKISPYLRQVGRLDVKFFFVDGGPDYLIAWKNPAFWQTHEAASVAAGFLSNMLVQNGPAANPTSPLVRRVMSSLDLINLGFYTESFLTSFALCDDTVQEVIRRGMERKGLGSAQQKEMMRAIKEERLKHYLTNVMLLCDWKSLESDDPDLFAKVMKANKLRNDVMHGARRTTRSEALTSVDALLDTVAWLRRNPFGYPIEEFPLLKVVEPDFIEIRKEGMDQ